MDIMFGHALGRSARVSLISCEVEALAFSCCSRPELGVDCRPDMV